MMINEIRAEYRRNPVMVNFWNGGTPRPSPFIEMDHVVEFKSSRVESLNLVCTASVGKIGARKKIDTKKFSVTRLEVVERQKQVKLEHGQNGPLKKNNWGGTNAGCYKS